jgi:hypothetical protein
MAITAPKRFVPQMSRGLRAQVAPPPVCRYREIPSFCRSRPPRAGSAQHWSRPASEASRVRWRPAGVRAFPHRPALRPSKRLIDERPTDAAERRGEVAAGWSCRVRVCVAGRHVWSQARAVGEVQAHRGRPALRRPRAFAALTEPAPRFLFGKRSEVVDLPPKQWAPAAIRRTNLFHFAGVGRRPGRENPGFSPCALRHRGR